MLSVPCPRLVYNEPGVAYSVLELETDIDDPDFDYNQLLGSCESVMLKYVVKDCEPNSGAVIEEDAGYDDEYALEDLDLLVSDFMIRAAPADFGGAWDALSPGGSGGDGDDQGGHEVEETYALSAFKSIEEATKSIVGFMGMAVCERSDKVADARSGGSVHAHTLLLVGLFRGHQVLIRAKLAMSGDHEAGVTMQISVRSPDEAVAAFVASAVV